MAKERLMTITEVAQMLRVCTNTIREWNNKGLFCACHLGPRGDRRFKREDIDNFIERGKR
ncbi:MAG TPA: helix-turn-helix domain-containing protein [Dehalococcoidia bacterium]|nr:helix-turn-helix domain-containing protein [Dehalococcoidia bacterium]